MNGSFQLPCIIITITTISIITNDMQQQHIEMYSREWPLEDVKKGWSTDFMDEGQ